jgi:hypothetical protein
MVKKQTERRKEVELLEDIKRLLVLGLIQSGVQGKNIAAILGIDPATITRMVSVRQIKKSK